MLTLRVVHPDFGRLTPVQQQQYLHVIDPQKPERAPKLAEFFSVHDDAGAHVYDMYLYCREDGQVFEVGTTRRIGGFAQGGTDCGDETLDRELYEALARFRAGPRAKHAAVATPAGRSSAKKVSARQVSAKKSR